MEADLKTINFVLCLIGIGLSMMFISGEVKNEKIMRWCFLGYFIVVVDLNLTRAFVFPNYIFLAAAALTLLSWFAKDFYRITSEA